MRNLLTTLCAALLVSAASLHAQADEDLRYYDIEVLVFEIMDERSRRAEQWPADINRELPEQMVELDKPLTDPMADNWYPQWSFKARSQEQLQLGEVSKLIENVDRYRILLHRAWRQPGLDKEAALAVHFSKEYAPAEDVAPMNRAPEPGLNDPRATDASVPGKSNLEGYIKIILSRYLHADVDLAYTTGLQEASPSIFGTDFLQPEIPAPTIYRLRQTRRMRSGELHYLDHPALGILIQITPVEEGTPASDS